MGIIQWARNGGVGDVLPFSDFAAQAKDLDLQGPKSIAGEAVAADVDTSDYEVNAAELAREKAKLYLQCDAARRGDVFTERYL